MKTRQWKIMAMGIGVLFMIAGEAWAQGPIGRRQARQSNRIAQGVRTGQISAREYGMLKREQNRIQQRKNRAFADGKVSPGERGSLRRMQDRAGSHIYKAKHNRARRQICAPARGPLHFRTRSAYNRCALTVRGVYGEPSWSLGWRFVLR